MFQSDYAVSSTNNFFYRVYAWMMAALCITAGVAYAVATSPTLYAALMKNMGVVILLFIAQIGLVVVLSAMLPRLSFTTAVALFIAYAASVGITLSSLVLIYTGASLFSTFLVAGGMFGCMALYGYLTKKDLTAIGSIAFMALIGIILGGLVNWWLQSAAFDFVLSALGVLVFAALTAHDMQKLKQINHQMQMQRQDGSKIAILGALMLYLDFLNLFLFLLDLMGKRRND